MSLIPPTFHDVIISQRGQREMKKWVNSSRKSTAMQDSPMLAPAGLFYLAYVASLVFLVSIPVLRDAATGRAAPHGAIIRAMAYGAYKFTSMSIMKAL
jgi:uncharacterized membrane protein